jgi:hypothetical protein
VNSDNNIPTELKTIWQVDGESTFINSIEYGWETERNYCRHRKNGGVFKHLKHPVGTSRAYFHSWEDANAEVIRRAEDDLKRTIDSIPRKQEEVERLKKRTKKEAYSI